MDAVPSNAHPQPGNVGSIRRIAIASPLTYSPNPGMNQAKPPVQTTAHVHVPDALRAGLHQLLILVCLIFRAFAGIVNKYETFS